MRFNMNENEPLEFIYCLKDDLKANVLLLYVQEANMSVKFYDENFKLVKENKIDTY